MDDVFKGDSIYSIVCTGDCCVGDEVKFSRAKFTGSFKKPKFAGYEDIEGKAIRESYGVEKQQHTFTIQSSDGETTRIKGRNLYANGTFRKPWENESARLEALSEKHERGDRARAEGDERWFDKTRIC